MDRASTSNDTLLQSGSTNRDGGLEALRGRLTCSVDEAAKALSIGRSTAFKGVHDGSLPALRISNRILISVPRLLAMLGIEDRRQTSQSEQVVTAKPTEER